MNLVARFAVGTCCGALAAFLYAAPDSARSVRSSANSSSDRTSVPAVAANAIRSEARISTRAGGAADDALSRTLAAAGEWAFIDPAGFFDYAETADSIDALIAGLELLIATDPERVWAIAGRFIGPDTPEVSELYLHAVRGMTGRDPFGAIARLESVTTGTQRGPILASIAEAYALIDADAALTWATSVVPPSTVAVGKVLETVASEDLLRAFEMMRRARSGAVNAQSLAVSMARAALSGRQPPATLASALAGLGDPDTDTLLTSLMQQWARREPESAVTWMAANEVHLTDELTRTIVYSLAFEDVTLAAELAGRVPPSAIEQWLDEVALRYGQFDLDQAMDWLAAYQGQPVYDAILERTLSGGLISKNASFVADYIETSGIDFDQDMIRAAADALAEQDPEAAIRWAMRLGNSEHSSWALNGVVDRWAQMDGPAATRWVLRQPRGAARDQILDRIMLSNVSSQAIDPVAIFDAYDSDSNAQRTLAEYISRSTRLQGDPRDASLSRVERLLELLTDPALRDQAEQQGAAETSDAE